MLSRRPYWWRSDRHFLMKNEYLLRISEVATFVEEIVEPADEFGVYPELTIGSIMARMHR